MKLYKFKYFYPEKPKLLVRGQPMFKKLSEHPLWIAEPKYNGQRVQLHLLDGEATFWGRQGEPLKYKPSNGVLEAIKNTLPQVGYYLLDGELRHNKVKGVKDKIVFWDVFIHNKKLQTESPYWVRRSLLLDLLKINDLEVISLIKQYTNNFEKAFNNLMPFEEFEGLVLKNTQGKLNLGAKSGPESRWMFKVRKETGRHRY